MSRVSSTSTVSSSAAQQQQHQRVRAVASSDLRPVTPLQHLNVGVPTRKHKSSRKHKGKLEEDVTDSDVYIAAKHAASLAQSLHDVRQLNWSENRTSELNTSILYSMDPQVRSSQSSVKSLSPPSSFHHLPSANKELELQSLQLDQDSNRLEREPRRDKKIRKGHEQEVLQNTDSIESENPHLRKEVEKHRRHREKKKSTTETNTARLSTTANAQNNFEADILASLPSNATPCSVCQPHSSPCKLLTCSQYAVFAQLQPRTLSSSEFQICLRSYAYQPLCVRVEPNSPQFLSVAPTPVFYVWPHQQHHLTIRYVGNFTKEYAALISNSDNPNRSVHFLIISTRLMSETDVTNGCALSHPSRFWDFAQSYHTHETRIPVFHQKGDGNHTTSIDSEKYQSLGIMSESNKAINHLVGSGSTSVKFDVPTSESSMNSNIKEVNPDPIKRSRSIRARTMVNLAAMRADIAGALAIDLPAPAKDTVATADLAMSEESTEDSKAQRLMQRRTLTRAISRRSSGDPSSPLPASLLSSALLNEASTKMGLNRDPSFVAAAGASRSNGRSASNPQNSKVDTSIQTEVSYLQQLQSMPLDQWEEMADYEVDHIATPPITSDLPLIRLQEMLSEWSQLLQSAEYRRLEEKSRLASIREQQQMEEGSSEQKALSAATSDPLFNPLSDQMQISQRRYLDRELAALDYERETLMLIEIEITKQIPFLIQQTTNYAVQTSPETANDLQAEFVTSRDRAIRVESIRSSHRMQLLQAIRRADSPRRPHSVAHMHHQRGVSSTSQLPQSSGVDSENSSTQPVTPIRSNSHSPLRSMVASVPARPQISPNKVRKPVSASHSPSFLRTQSVYSQARNSSLSVQKHLIRDRYQDLSHQDSITSQQHHDQQQRHMSRAASAAHFRSPAKVSSQRTFSAQPRPRHSSMRPPVELNQSVGGEESDVRLYQPLSEEDNAENAVYEAASEETERRPTEIAPIHVQHQYELDEYESQQQLPIKSSESHLILQKLGMRTTSDEQYLPDHQPFEPEEEDEDGKAKNNNVNEEIEYENEYADDNDFQ